MLVRNKSLGYGEVTEALRKQAAGMEHILLKLQEAVQCAARTINDVSRARAKIQIFVASELQPYIRTIYRLIDSCRGLDSGFRTARLRDRSVSSCQCFSIAISDIAALSYRDLRERSLQDREF